MRAVLVAAGEPPAPAFLRGHVRPGDLVVCADAGYAAARAAGVEPHLVVGDLDSLPPEDRAALEASGIELEVHPAAKDAADLHLALEAAVRRGADEVAILGALGGRLDHALFNVIGVLCRAETLGVEARILDPAAEIRLVRGTLRLEERAGWFCSLLSLDATVRDVTLEGFEFPLDGEELSRASTRGLSNRVLTSPAAIRVGHGLLLAVLVDPSRGSPRSA